MSKILRWWLFLCISLAAMVIAYYFNFFHELYEKDISVLSKKIGSYCKIWNGEKIEKTKIWNIKSLKQISYF